MLSMCNLAHFPYQIAKGRKNGWSKFIKNINVSSHFSLKNPSSLGKTWRDAILEGNITLSPTFAQGTQPFPQETQPLKAIQWICP